MLCYIVLLCCLLPRKIRYQEYILLRQIVFKKLIKICVCVCVCKLELELVIIRLVVLVVRILLTESKMCILNK